MAPENWSPPDFGDLRRPRIGASVIEQFVAGHDPGDVLRELVQNEFDGGGDRLEVTFGPEALDVVGNGRGITGDGWTRLSVIVGTGRVVGDAEGERVAPKTNGIGSKNFGLRSLFIFGDEIYVRSAGQVCVLDLRTLETGRMPDPAGRGTPGVRLRVPFRRERFELLEPFTAESEQRAFEVMAGGMLATLVKLALAGRRRGLREVLVRSSRTGRTLTWRQDAERVRTTLRGASAVRRVGRLVDAVGAARTRQDFGELEFGRAVDIPPAHLGRDYPTYFSSGAGAIRLALSVPLAKGRPDERRPGHFHYPLQAPDATTGCLVGVSAPFDLDNDRSTLVENRWNEWLMDEAARLTVDLLAADWTDRFGPAAFRILATSGPAKPSRFLDEVHRRLRTDACWPTRASGPDRNARAEQVAVASTPALDGFLAASRHLDHEFAADEGVRSLALASGAALFTPSSLVRLRCAGADRNGLRTKPRKGEADITFKDHGAALRDPGRQAAMAAALSGSEKALTRENRDDLRLTASTLAADGSLAAAAELVRVAPDLWDACPVPLERRLHPCLTAHRAVARHSRGFDEQAWMVAAAGRAATDAIGDAEREALYGRLLDDATRLARGTLAAVRRAPVVRDGQGRWAAPADMVQLEGPLAKFLAPAVRSPSEDLRSRPAAVARLRIRTRPSGGDLVAYATTIGERRNTAERFERVLAEHLRLLTPAVVADLASLPFLRTRSGDLAPPQRLHVDTPVNRVCVGDPSLIAAGTDQVLLRRLGVREHPSLQTIVECLDGGRRRSEKPARPEVLYPALVAALAREKRPKTGLADTAVLWVDGAYHAPSSVLVGSDIPDVFVGAAPVFRRSDGTADAYVELGAKRQPKEEHWAALFRHASAGWDRLPVDDRRRRLLTECYRHRGWRGLPEGLEALECLLARDGLLYSLDELRTGRVVENDFPALADALGRSAPELGIVDLSDRNRSFFLKLGIHSLSSIAGAGAPVFGTTANAPIWFKRQHRDALVDALRRPILSRALHGIAVGQRHAFPEMRPTAVAELVAKLDGIVDVVFLETVSREYDVRGVAVRIPIEAAVGDGFVGLVAPRTKLDFQQLVAQSLAELSGAATAAQARALSAAVLPLVLCRTTDEIAVCMERAGIDLRAWTVSGDPEFDFAAEALDDFEEDLVRQVMHGLRAGDEADGSDRDAGGVEAGRETPALPPPQPSPASLPPLPDIDKVEMTMAASSGRGVGPSHKQQGCAGCAGGPGGWTPRSVAQMERDRDVGERGEALVYRMELARVAAAGHPDPGQVVVWTSRTDPGADHDIRSIDEGGRPLWIEVKATTGSDGRFEWPRREFEKAVRERDRYELWRVYKAADASPVAKRFPDPAGMLAGPGLQLGLGTLRARVEDAE